MKYVLAFLLFVLSAVLSVAVLTNVYFAVATAGQGELSEIGRPNYVVLGILALSAITSIAGGTMMLRRRRQKL
jgi:hypothetical protein